MSIFNPTPTFLKVFDAYCTATGYSETTASRLFLKGGRRIAEIKAGGGISFAVLERAIQQMSDDWPKDQAHLWPREVPRPKKARRQKQTDLALAR